MAKKILQIVETAYRATLEEQDDPVLWLAAALSSNGLTTDVLLRGNAVNYAVREQDAAGLAFGGWRQTQPPHLADDIAALPPKGVAVYVLAEDLAERGLGAGDLVPGLERVTRDRLPGLFAMHDQVWHW